MSFIKHFPYGERNVIYKDDREHDKREYNYKNKVLEGSNILIVGSVGSGKSVFSLQMAQTFFENKCTIINLTNKSRSEWDNAYGLFEVKNSHHVNLVRKYGREVWSQRLCSERFRLWCPYSTTGLKKRGIKGLPKVRFYTHSIKSLTEDVIATIMSVEGDKTYVKAAHNVLKNLKSSATLRHYLFECSRQLTGEIDISGKYDDDYDFLVLKDHRKLLGDARTVQNIKDSFKVFLKDNFLMPESWSMNLDMVKILNDNKHIHFFIDFFLTDKKSKYVNLVLLLELIKEALGTGLVQHHVVLVFEEIKILLPSKDVGYIRGLEDTIIDLLSSIRSAGKGVTTIGTTQVFGDTSQQYRALCNEIYFGKISVEDIKVLKRDFSISMSQQRVLEHLGVGEFVQMGRFLTYDGFIH